MASTPDVRSWQVTPEAFRTPALALAMVVAMLVGAELLARTPVVHETLHVPSVGSSSRRFELQLFGLQRYVRSEGALECLVLGNSTALVGVDPDAIDRSYRAATGRSLRCYNFGVEGMSASAAGVVAPLLVQRYRPRLVIYIVGAGDVGQSVDGPRLAAEPWVQYQTGSFTLAGALASHSAAFRYYLLYRQWLDPTRWPAARSGSGATAAGFFALDRQLPRSPELWARTQASYARIARQPLSQPELAGIVRLTALAPQVPVVLVEPPAHERLRRWARRTTPFYADAIAAMRQVARARRVPFWRAPSRRVMPPEAFADFVHLDRAGAVRFSEWLGARLARAVREGRLEISDAPTSTRS